MAQRRVLVIGLDAADLDVMRPLIERGEMPNVGGLIADGAAGVLHSTVPPVSAPAWASFLTGNQPGRHGLYSFVLEKGEPTRMQLANLTDIHGPKIWDLVAMQGARPLVANVPVTWPPPEFDGALVTGMLTPESRDVAYTHPPELRAEIERAVPGYRIDVDRTMLDDREGLFAAMSGMMRTRRDLFVHLIREQRWDLAVTVFTNTDRGQHSFWRGDRGLVDDLFRQVDGHIGDLLAEIDRESTVVMLMSDHGFQSAPYKLYLNRYLADRGLLATRRAAKGDPLYDARRPDFFEDFQGGQGDAGGKRSGLTGPLRQALASVGVGGKLVVDWTQTRAFMWSLDTGGVGVNLKSRYPHGVVEDADYETVRSDVVSALSALRLPDGRPAFRSVRRREEVYHGPFTERAPDVVVEPDDALDFGMRLDPREALREHRNPEGHHSPRGFVSLTGPGCRSGASIEGNIVDCVPTILHALGLAVPEGLDGSVIADAFDDGRAVQTMPAPDGGAPAGSSGDDPVYSGEEEEGLRRSLEGLGYL